MNDAEFLQLIQDHKGILFKISNSYCRNRDDREDLMQEIIYQLWKSAGGFDTNRKFSTWMYRIALNVAISYYRQQRRSGLRIAFGGELHLMEMADDSAETDTDEKIGMLQRFISDQNELDKALMILYLEERPYREIAEILGITETNVATKLSRIKGRLKQHLLTINKAFL
jgi:RNA polymerase sigma factor (sigma-70 family)